jgi:anti-anti-sigma regulatory factor
MAIHVDASVVVPIMLPSRLTIAQVAESHVALCSSLRAEGTVELDARGVERIDGLGLQLLVAFVRDARQSRVAVRWVTSPALEEAARLTGLSGELMLPERTA